MPCPTACCSVAKPSVGVCSSIRLPRSGNRACATSFTSRVRDSGSAVRRLARPRHACELTLKVCNQATHDQDRGEAEGNSTSHVARQRALGAPLGTEGHERDGAERGTAPAQRRGVVWAAERIAGGI